MYTCTVDAGNHSYSVEYAYISKTAAFTWFLPAMCGTAHAMHVFALSFRESWVSGVVILV